MLVLSVAIWSAVVVAMVVQPLVVQRQVPVTPVNVANASPPGSAAKCVAVTVAMFVHEPVLAVHFETPWLGPEVKTANTLPLPSADSAVATFVSMRDHPPPDVHL